MSDRVPVPPTDRDGVRRRRAWLALGSVVTVIALAWVLVQSVGVLARTSDEVDVRDEAEGVRGLVVDVGAGTVEVRGTDRDEVVVTGTVTSGLTATRHSERIEDDRFVVRSRCTGGPLSTFCSVDHVIEVPADMPVLVRSSETTVSLVGLTGSVDVSTSNQGIEATDLSGADVDLVTSNAAVRLRGASSAVTRVETSNAAVELSFVDPVDLVEVRTSNGAVRIEVPDTSDAYAVDLDTSDGTASADVRTDPAATRRISAATDNEDISVRYAPGR
jgi:hypothetical protein